MSILCSECKSAVAVRKQQSISCAGLSKKQFHSSCITASAEVDLIVFLKEINGLECKGQTCTKDGLLINRQKLKNIVLMQNHH